MEELENGVTESVAGSETETLETGEAQIAAQENPQTEESGSKPLSDNDRWKISRERAQKEYDDKLRRIREEDDREYATRFAGYKNPKTGAEIKSKKDYFDALDAQREMEREEAIRRATANQSAEQAQAIRNLIENDPEKRRLNARVQELERKQLDEQAGAAFNRDFAELQKLEPALKTVNDLEKLDGFDKIVQLVQEKGLDMVTAYKAVNFGRATQASQAAGKQAAINAAKGKNHLAAHDGQAQPGTQKVMSESMLSIARETFPDKSDAEIQKLYNSI